MSTDPLVPGVAHGRGTNTTAAAVDPIPDLIQLLGQPVVFIDWPRGVKGNSQKWGYLTSAHMTPQYLSKLKLGNIGVALGEASGGLCAIDIDADEFVDPFRWANPGLAETLQTHGARGCVFWLRFKGSYPKNTSFLKTESGQGVGEFRSTGSQSIIWGIHPDTQRPYEFVLKGPVVEVDFESIQWPDQIKKGCLGVFQMQPRQPHRGRDDRHSAGQAIVCLQFAMCEVQAIDRKQAQCERGSVGRDAIPRQETLGLAEEKPHGITDGDAHAEGEHHQPIGVGGFKKFIGRIHQAKPSK